MVKTRTKAKGSSTPAAEPGRYRINVVAERTGIPAATLRAWERRYGIPTPSRTESAYRLYSEHDIGLLERMNDLCKSGLSAAEAAKTALEETPTPVVPAAQDMGRSKEALVEQILDAILRFDPFLLETVVSFAMSVAPPLTSFDQIFRPALQEIGSLWESGRISVAQEHLASEVIGRALRSMRLLVEPSEGDRLVLLACLEDEEHALPLYGVAFRFASWGYRTVVLGPRTPPSALATAVDALKPTVIGLSATIAPPAQQAKRIVEAYAEACRGRPWLIGGQGVKELANHVARTDGIVVDRDLAELRPIFERKARLVSR
ncbi:MAG: MerR family transcriptional regulator [Myxococcota bacterium]